MNRILIAAGLAIGLFAGGFAAGWTWRDDRAAAAEARHAAEISAAAVGQINDTRATEHAQADKLAAIGESHEKDRAAAEAVPAAVAAELRDGTLQLRDDLATCHTARLSQAVAGAVERDARAELRPEVVGAVLRIVTDAEDHVRACQAVIAADRAETP